MTYLQEMLRDGRLPLDAVQAAVGCSRATVYRWRQGSYYPGRKQAAALVGLAARLRIEPPLDFNGCYREGRHGD